MKEYLEKALEYLTDAEAATVLEVAHLQFRVNGQWVGVLDGAFVDSDEDPVVGVTLDQVTGVAVAGEFDSVGSPAGVAGLVPTVGGPGSAGYIPASLPPGGRRLTDTGTGRSVMTTANGTTVMDSAVAAIDPPEEPTT